MVRINCCGNLWPSRLSSWGGFPLSIESFAHHIFWGDGKEFCISAFNNLASSCGIRGTATPSGMFISRLLSSCSEIKPGICKLAKLTALPWQISDFSWGDTISTYLMSLTETPPPCIAWSGAGMSGEQPKRGEECPYCLTRKPRPRLTSMGPNKSTPMLEKWGLAGPIQSDRRSAIFWCKEPLRRRQVMQDFRTCWLRVLPWTIQYFSRSRSRTCFMNLFHKNARYRRLRWKYDGVFHIIINWGIVDLSVQLSKVIHPQGWDWGESTCCSWGGHPFWELQSHWRKCIPEPISHSAVPRWCHQHTKLSSWDQDEVSHWTQNATTLLLHV